MVILNLNLYSVYLKMAYILSVKTYKTSGRSCSQPRTLYSIKPGMGLEGAENSLKMVFNNLCC